MFNRSTGQVSSETGEAAYGLGNAYKRTYTSKTKATEAALFIEWAGIISCLFSFLLWLCRSVLLVWCRIEFVGDQDNAIVFYTVFICPLFGFEVALYGKQGALCDLG